MAKYMKLVIVPADPNTEVWVADEDGHFVQKETGVMRTDLLPGRYSVQFGLRSTKHWIVLHADTEFKEPKP